MIKLGVNIDHVATIREARKTYEPSPLDAAKACVRAGCDSIVCHLREDRRHINDADVIRLRRTVKTRLNLEMSVVPEIVGIACRIRPDQATLVPDAPDQKTSDHGWNLLRDGGTVAPIIPRLKEAGGEGIVEFPLNKIVL